MTLAEARRNYMNVPMTASQAQNMALDAARIIETMPIHLTPNGDGYDARMPVEAFHLLAVRLWEQARDKTIER